ncbi:hypothetical protein OC846_005390 [Tilletia horrida]|uniref:Band 7 domain-containing protein n=1 Tax=Tilletia horrida TaxID=155126 RepID=A0AAN6JW14_9BASI|nr:hypothetical protein OC845_005360 [Tilletia horrida]KAK0546151.1 hypothetical protein OC846_005390 [Tilletia horrida]KAK0565600.1 hypothetical protein OC861_003694 [Tilletia horrida]
MSNHLTDSDFPTAPRYDEAGVGSSKGGAANLAPASDTKTAQQPIIKVQPLKKAEMQPSYAQDLGVDDIEHNFYGSMMNFLGSVAGAMGQFPCCICCPNPFQEVDQGTVGLVTRFGRLYKSVDPGLVRINPFSERLRVVDVKITLIAIPRQTVLTSDNLTVDVDSTLCYHVSNPLRAAFSISNVKNALSERAQTTLRDVIGSRTLQSILTDREAVAQQVAQLVESVSESWGVTVESLLLKDISLSAEVQESLASAATQRRIGDSKVIAARAEVEAAKLMREAADQLSTEAAIQIRQLEALQAMAKTAGSKVIFVPMSLAHQFPQTGVANLGSGSGDKGKGVQGSSGAQPVLNFSEVNTFSQLAG